MESINICSALLHEKELMRMLPLVQDIAIIEYDGKSPEGSYAFHRLLSFSNISTSIVKHIVLLGNATTDAHYHKTNLSSLFPDADIKIMGQSWEDIDITKLQLCSSLVLHMAFTLGITDRIFESCRIESVRFMRFVNKIRKAYYVCVVNRERDLWSEESPFAIIANLRLNNFSFPSAAKTEIKQFCKEKRDYIQNCIEHLTEIDGFFQCVEEAEQGCETCNQCTNYKRHHRCPYAQHIVANFYREGNFVPQNDKIAHQWEIMAARQGYALARIQMADDIKEGRGCEKDVNKALQIYTDYASQMGYEHCVEQIIAISESEPNISPIIAVPFIAKQAEDGNIEMILKLWDAFQNSRFGLPKDIVQQVEWMKKGAELGHSKCVKQLAEMYESQGQWKDAYQWYNKLREVAPDLVHRDKMEEVELMMLTNGATIEEVAVLGENYLYGYFGKQRNFNLAYKCINYANHKGIVRAKGLLALMYYNGWGVEIDKNKAICFFRSAAKMGDLMSMDLLDRLFSEYDSDKIISMVENGIANNDKYAYYLKGVYLRDGHYYSKDEKQSFQFMQQAAKRRLPKAQYLLSEMYASGQGTTVNPETSKNWLQMSANNGYYEATGKWGMMLFDSSLWGDNKNQSFRYLLHAYEQGFNDVYWHLAQCYMHGYGTSVDKNKAYPLYQQAAENGILQAQEMLCKSYFRGDGSISKNYALCVKWGEEAIRQGSKAIRFETAYSCSHIGKEERAQDLYFELCLEGNAAAMNNYACGLTDPQESAKWFLNAANKGDDYGMWNIAKHYKNGNGIEKNLEKAIEMFEKSANTGHVGAMMDLARIYRDGDEVPQNGDLAIKWYKKAADANEESALFELAKIYRQGSLIDKNIDKAIHYYKIAAERGNASAMVAIGRIHEDGENGNQNVYKAVYWYRKAAAKGNREAIQNLSRLKSNRLDDDGNLISDEEDDLWDEF
ncbi:MAG: tetratricopeptide repeat protein [Sodaliphilus sp.]